MCCSNFCLRYAPACQKQTKESHRATFPNNPKAKLWCDCKLIIFVDFKMGCVNTRFKIMFIVSVPLSPALYSLYIQCKCYQAYLAINYNNMISTYCAHEQCSSTPTYTHSMHFRQFCINCICCTYKLLGQRAHSGKGHGAVVLWNCHTHARFSK